MNAAVCAWEGGERSRHLTVDDPSPLGYCRTTLNFYAEG